MKKVVTMLLCLVMGLGCFAFTGCNGGGTKQQTIKLWGSAEDQQMLAQMVESFKKDNTQYADVDIQIAVMGENDAKTEILKDLTKGADVFAFSNDQIGELVDNSALYDLSNAAGTADVKSRNAESAIQAATVGGKLYAYPSSAESYYLFYNKDVYTADDVKTLEGMIAKKADGKKTLVAQFNEGYYTPMFFAAAGCTLYGTGGSDPADCTWNNENGLKAAKYMKTLKANGIEYMSESDLKNTFIAKTTSAVITGTWNYNTLKDGLGDKLGLAVLPTVTFSGDATPSQLRPFSGMKLYGVRSTTEHAEVSIALADYLTNEANQLKRFNDRGFLPVNKNLATNEAVLAKEQCKVEVDSIAISISKPAHAQGGKFWDAAAALVKDLVDNADTVSDDAKIQAQLDKFVNDITTKKA